MNEMPLNLASEGCTEACQTQGARLRGDASAQRAGVLRSRARGSGGQQTRRWQQVGPHTRELGTAAGVKQPFKHDGVPRGAVRGAKENETGQRSREGSMRVVEPSAAFDDGLALAHRACWPRSSALAPAEFPGALSTCHVSHSGFILLVWSRGSDTSSTSETIPQGFSAAPVRSLRLLGGQKPALILKDFWPY